MFELLAIGIAFVGAASTLALANPVSVPGPVIGGGLSGLVVAGIGIYAWYRNRK